MDLFLPTVDVSFIESQIVSSNKVIPGSRLSAGHLTTYTLEAHKLMHKRLVVISEFQPGQINFDQAMAHAICFGFISQLLKWFEENKNWKDGAYFS